MTRSMTNATNHAKLLHQYPISWTWSSIYLSSVNYEPSVLMMSQWSDGTLWDMCVLWQGKVRQLALRASLGSVGWSLYNCALCIPILAWARGDKGWKEYLRTLKIYMTDTHPPGGHSLHMQYCGCANIKWRRKGIFFGRKCKRKGVFQIFERVGFEIPKWHTRVQESGKCPRGC